MQYLVQVSGLISDKQSKAYVVNSSSEENAKIIATQNFCDDFATDNIVIHTKSQRRTHKAIVAFVLMLIPILLSLINWKTGHDSISISPDYISCLYSAAIYTAFVVRFKGIHRTVNSWIDIVFCVLSVLLLASFIKTILATKIISVFGLASINISTNVVLPVAIILSWLGLKFVSLACMAGITIVALSNMLALNDAMGKIFGPLYVICSFVSIILYLSIEPAFVESVMEIRHFAINSLLHLSNDVKSAKQDLENMKSAVLKKSESKENNKNEE